MTGRKPVPLFSTRCQPTASSLLIKLTDCVIAQMRCQDGDTGRCFALSQWAERVAGDVEGRDDGVFQRVARDRNDVEPAATDLPNANRRMAVGHQPPAEQRDAGDWRQTARFFPA